MEYILLLNNEISYPLLSFNTYDKDGDFLLTIQARDFAEVKRVFANIESLIIMRGSTVISEYTKYKTYRRISMGDDYYDPQIGEFLPTIQVSVGVPDLAQQVADISQQLNTNIDYETISLDDYKKYKIGLSKTYLAEYLESHPLLSTAHNNTAAYYSVTKEKQDLMTQQYLSYQIAKAVDPEHAVLTYNATGEVCEPWEEAEFLQLIIEVKAYVYPLISYQQTIEKLITHCETKDEVSEIAIDYGSADSDIIPDSEDYSEPIDTNTDENSDENTDTTTEPTTDEDTNDNQDTDQPTDDNQTDDNQEEVIDPENE